MALSETSLVKCSKMSFIKTNMANNFICHYSQQRALQSVFIIIFKILKFYMFIRDNKLFSIINVIDCVILFVWIQSKDI